MRGIQPRTLTDRDLIRHCANELELTTNPLPYEFQLELIRRLNSYVAADADVQVTKTGSSIDPDAD